MSLILKKRMDMKLRNKLDMEERGNGEEDAHSLVANSHAEVDSNSPDDNTNIDHCDDDEEEDNEETNEAFSIPQKFTKSGRKRAVPFPIKVCTGSYTLNSNNNDDYSKL
jgi:hypothetical protein